MIVPAVGSVNYGVGSVPLPAYLWHHQWLDECSFWGVQTPGKKVSCLWTQHQRNQLDHYLCVALQKLRECLPYALMPEYTVDERVTPLDSSMRCTIKLASRYIHELGVEAWDSIFKNAVVDYEVDPAVIKITGDFSGFDCSEIIICHPGTDIPIDPSAMEFSSDQQMLTIKVPWCRLVTIEMAENGFFECCPQCVYCPDLPALCLEETVDIKRRYTAQPAVKIMCAPSCKCRRCCEKPCQISYEPGCGVILDAKRGIIHIDSTEICSCCVGKRYALVSYKSGLVGFNGKGLMQHKTIVEMISRLAHALMPQEPCSSCSHMTEIWRRDREPHPNPNFSTPFGGGTQGEIAVWRWVSSLPGAGAEVFVA